MKALSAKLRKLQYHADFKLHWRIGLVGINHLAFADDLVVLCGSHVKSVNLIFECLDWYERQSGLCIKKNKSAICCSKSAVHISRIIERNIGIPATKLLISYLGVPLVASKLKAKECNMLVDKIMARIKL